MKKRILFLLLAISSTIVFAQNEIQLLKDFHNGQGGIYYVYEIFEWKEKDLAFITMSEPGTGLEAYVTDGTSEGTFLLKDISPGDEWGSPANFIAVGDYVYFSAFLFETDVELWKTDGTTDGTALVKDLNPLIGSVNGGFHGAGLNNKLFFSGTVESSTGLELCVSDGTEGGTYLFLNINPTAEGSSSPENFIEFDNKLFFSAWDGFNGRELWVTDGTVDGTQMFLDAIPGDGSGFPKLLGVCGNYLYFTATTTEYGEELWITDGTVDGTEMVKDIAEGSTGSHLYEDYFTCFEDEFYFVCNDWISGYELWKSDGTASGTFLFKDFNNLGDYASNINLLTVVNNKLYFRANPSPEVYQSQLYESLGTPESTVVYDNIPVEEMSNIQDLIACNDRLFIYAEYPQYFRILSVGGVGSPDIVVHGGEGLNYINEEGFGNIHNFFTIGETLYFMADFNNGLGWAWYSLYFSGGTDINTNKSNAEIVAYPNPASNYITVDPQSESEYSVTITDVTGKVISTLGSLNGINDIDLSDFQSGMYLLQLNVNGIVKTEKLLITK